MVHGLRGIAGLWVLLSTIVRTAWPAGGFRGWGAFTGVYPLGIFAVLSGLVLGLGIATHGRPERFDLKLYAARRLLRFVPVTWAAVLLTLMFCALWIGDVSGTVWDETLPITASATLVQLLFLSGLVANSGPNPAMRGVALLVQCSLAFPLMAWMWRRVGAFGMGIIGLVLALAPSIFDLPRMGTSLLALGLFAAGMAAAGLASEPGIIASARRAAPWWIIAVGGSVAALATFVWATPSTLEGREPVVTLSIGLATVGLIMHALDNAEGLVNRALCVSPLRTVGAMSLSVCLATGPVVQLSWLIFCDRSGLAPGAIAVILGLASPMVLAVSFELARWFEQPCSVGEEREVFFAQLGLDDVRTVLNPESRSAAMSLREPIDAAMVTSAIAVADSLSSIVDLTDGRDVVIDLRDFAPPLPPPDPRSLVH